ncbi:response regulator [Flavobacterium sp.]|uniref:response regulator n=1 Tax=Flavobacterium sp. TaxID=239 RepID=UPI0025FB2394|nr:response regulator [Flavobacterium sp.]
MKTDTKIKLFLVDDDAVFLKAMEIQFMEHADFEIETFPTGELCIKNLTKKPDIIILDYHLDGIVKNAINGMQTLDKIKEFNAGIPVIMLSSQDKIEVAVSCIHHKAFDYVVKSETSFVRLQKVISTFFKYQKMENELNWYMERM